MASAENAQQPVDHDNDPSVPPPTEAEILEGLLHCGSPFFMKFPTDQTQIRHAGALDYTFDESLLSTDDEGNPAHPYEYAEHVRLGDLLQLTWHDGTEVLGKDKKLRLDNGLEVTYGQICALGGDFFGNKEPICFGNGLESQVRNFEAGFATLAGNDTGKNDAEGIIKLKQTEVDLVNAASQSGESPAEVYRTKVSKSDDIEAAISGFLSSRAKGYAGLALINFDHFGEDARTAYNAGHTAALRKAATSKDAATLEAAYALNAFADHFLEDSFASGHLRVPRRQLHGTVRYDKDLCSKYMHDEDNKNGLKVSNHKGESWTMYGDSMLLEDCNADNLRICHAALMASTREVHEAWSTGQVKQPGSFEAWQHAPIISTAFSDANHAPLFNSDGYPRDDINSKWCREYKQSYWTWSYPTLLLQFKASSNF